MRTARRLWVAFSGGADSTALLLTVTRLFPELDIRASHVNHGVQDEALTWVAHCKALCARLNVPLDVGELRPPPDRQFADGFEAWARDGRYAHWQQLLGKDELLLLAHHETDQRETVVVKLLQGRLPQPMPWTRPLGSSGAQLLRPWLNQPATSTRALLEGLGESWIEDPSNHSRLMLRNRLRHDVLPVLSADWSEAFDRCGVLTDRLLGSYSTRISDSAGSGSKPTAESRAGGSGELLRLPLSALECPWAVQGALMALAPEPDQRFSRRQVAAALGQLQRQSTATQGQADRQGQVLGHTAYGFDQRRPLTLWLADDGPEPQLLVWREPRLAPQSLRLSAEGQLELELEHGGLRVLGPPHAEFRLRTPQTGDRVRVGEKHRPLRELLRDHCVPRWARASYPLLCVPSGAESVDEIVAVPSCLAGNRLQGWFQRK